MCKGIAPSKQGLPSDSTEVLQQDRMVAVRFIDDKDTKRDSPLASGLA